jgi:hypothetical protein
MAQIIILSILTEKNKIKDIKLKSYYYIISRNI